MRRKQRSQSRVPSVREIAEGTAPKAIGIKIQARVVAA